MEKLISFINNIVEFLKIYGAEGVFWIVVLIYGLSYICPQLQVSFLTSNNVLLLGMLMLGIKTSIKKSNDEARHIRGNHARTRANVEVRNELVNLKNDIGATRVYVLEMHNGNQNSGKLPFLYADMTFEETNENIYVNREFQNINLSLFPFAEYIFNVDCYIGTVKGLENIDRKFYHRISEVNQKNCALMPLKHKGNIIGLVGAAIPYAITEEKRDKIYKSFVNRTNAISDYLSFE